MRPPNRHLNITSDRKKEGYEMFENLSFRAERFLAMLKCDKYPRGNVIQMTKRTFCSPSWG